MNQTHKFSLDKTSKKQPCPGCGKRTFVPYVYTADQAFVDSGRFGRCDRQNNCAYHSHPTDDQTFQPDADRINKPIVEEVIEQILPSKAALLKQYPGLTRPATSNFHKYATQKLLNLDKLVDFGVLSDGEKTIFIHKNKDGQVTNAKSFLYKTDGHRDKRVKSFYLKQPPHTPQKKNQNGSKIIVKKYLVGFFGEHLLDPDKQKPVCIVESEKTAALAAQIYENYDWIACGSANGVTEFKIQAIFNRKILWIADSDVAGRENSSIDRMTKYNLDFQIVDLWPDRTDGFDLADAIDQGVRPDIKEGIVTPATKPEEAEAPKYDDSWLDLKLPDGLEWPDVKKDVIAYNHFQHENRIHMVRNAKGREGNFLSPITNFSIKPLGLVESSEFPRRLLQVTNVYGKTKLLQIPTKAFASQTEFTVFIESEGNFQYDGIGTDLKKIRSRLYDNMQSYEEVETLGWHADGYFIFSNGVYNGKFEAVDKLGFVEMGKKNFFIEFNSAVNDRNHEDFEDEKKFKYIPRTDVTLKSWADLFVKVHKEHGQITLAWYMASLFRDFIYSKFKFFPHLFLFGPPGTGKSQVGWSIRAMGFAGIKKPFNLSGGTKVAFHREFMHYVNFPTWFDEYDNSIDYDRVQSLKAAYDGAGHKKSVKDSDKRTKTVPVNSACMISGQQLPIADNALFKRCILEQFHQTEYTDEEQQDFRTLQDMEEPGLTFITAGFMNYRKTVESDFLGEFEGVFKEFTAAIETRGEQQEDRMVRNICIPVAMYKLMHKHIGQHLPFDYETLKKVALDKVIEQMKLIAGANETNTFWDMVEFLVEQQLVKEMFDYKFREGQRMVSVYSDKKSVDKDLGKATTVLYMRLTKIIPLYRQEFKRQNQSTASPMDKGSLLHYIKHQKYYIGMSTGQKFQTADHDTAGKYKSTSSSCIMLNFDMMEELGIELKRDSSADNMAAEPDEVSASDLNPDVSF
jgi:hypothetical protein